jgi:hypothetical protein
MQSGENFISADPPPQLRHLQSLISAAIAGDWGFGEHFGLLLRSWRRTKDDVSLAAVCSAFWATFEEVSARKGRISLDAVWVKFH